MSWGSALITLVFGVLLPTLDVYSDLNFMVRLFKGNYYSIHWCERMVPPHPKFGAAMIPPLLLAWLLVAREWYKEECGLTQKLLTLPLLIFQVYLQWRALRVLFYAKWKKQKGWQVMKEEWENGITHIGKDVINRIVPYFYLLKLFCHCFRALFGICTSGTYITYTACLGRRRM